jgi:hypothetical protein
MLAEFVAKIAALAEKAQQPTLTADPSRPGRYWLAYQNELMDIHRPPAARNPRLATLEDLADYLKAECPNDCPGIFHAPDLVTAHLGDDRHEAATVHLEHSATFCALQLLSTDRDGLSQSQAIRLLRHTFAGCIPDHVIPALRKLDFHRQSIGTRTVEHGRESLGKAVETTVQQAAEIPEEIRITVPVYVTLGASCPVTITCTIYLDLERERIYITPRPDELALAVQRTHDTIHERLKELCPGIPVYHGQP